MHGEKHSQCDYLARVPDMNGMVQVVPATARELITSLPASSWKKRPSQLHSAGPGLARFFRYHPISLSRMHSSVDRTPNVVLPQVSPPASAWRLQAPFWLMAAGFAALVFVDGPVARLNLTTDLPKTVVQWLNQAETFGNGAGVVFFFVAVAALDPRRTRCVVRLACATWGAGIAANVVKLTIGRCRPYLWIQGNPESTSTWEQFQGLLPLGLNEHEWQSFPSAHTATAFGLAFGLSTIYPQGRRLFIGLAAMVACQRVAGDMHYVSDTLFAAAIAWCVARGLYGDTPLARRFTAWERRIGAASPVVDRRAA